MTTSNGKAIGYARVSTRHQNTGRQVVDLAAAGKDLGGRRPQCTDSQIHNAHRLITAGEPASQAARDLGMPRATLYRRISTLS